MGENKKKYKKKRSYDSTLFVFSHSSMETMNKCTRSWWWRYIKKHYPKVGDKDHQDFGNYLHDIAENYDGSGMDKIKELAKKLRSKYTFNDKEYKAKEKIGLTRLRNYFDEYIPEYAKENNKIYTEKQLFFPIDEEFDYLAKIDLLYQTAPGEWVCADWKTGKKTDVSKQLAFYWWGLKQKNKVPIKKMTFHTIYLCELGVDHYVQEDVMNEDWVPMIESKIYGNMRRVKKLGYNIEDKENWKVKPGPLCPWCDYYKSGDCPGKDTDEPK